MKQPIVLIILSFVLISITLCGCDYVTGAALAPSFVSPLSLSPYSDITPRLANSFLMLSSVQIRFIDVRTPAEYAAGHVPSATNINYSASNFKEKISLLDRSDRYTVYCKSGYRSNLARNIMKELGFKYVFNITDGYDAWVAAGLPIEK